MKKSKNGVELFFDEIDKLSILHMNDSILLRVEGPPNMEFSAENMKIISHSWNGSPDYHTLRLGRSENDSRLTWKINNKSI